MVHSVWQDFLTIVHEELGSRVVETWFKAVELNRWDRVEKVVYLQAPNTFVGDWLEKNYRIFCQVHLSRLLNILDIKVVFITLQSKKNEMNVSSELLPPGPIAPQATAVSAAVKMYKPAQTITCGSKKRILLTASSEQQGNINKNYTFNTFVVGPSNSLAYAAARAVGQKPGNLYNPLFIYGESGLGKTHLLHAIGNEVRSFNKDAVVLYQTADRFVSEFINAIRFDKIHLFQKKYQLVDVLLIDDIQFISNKDTTQEAFFHIFNSLYDARKQIVFSSDTFPQNINGIAERLRSRLASGMVTDIHPPCVEIKTAILKRKAEASGELLPDEVAHFLASYVVSNIRELEGALIRVIAFAHLTKQEITLDLARSVFNPIEKIKKEVTDFRSIIRVMGKFFSYSLEDLRSKNRNKDVVFARQLAIYLMKKNTDKSLRDIGTYLGGRNHATIKHAVSRIEQVIQKDGVMKKRIDQILKEFE